jgi:membrane peptidoglycan carboxypeptidase
VYLVFLRDLPSIHDIENSTLPESSVIRDRDGNELYSIFSGDEGKRTYVSLDQISSRIKEAVIATEDKTFFENQGIDVRGLFRSVFNYIS